MALVLALYEIRLRCLAARQEGISYDLACLPPCDVRERPEVWTVLSIAWLSRSTAWIPTHEPTVSKAIDPDVEGIVCCHILKYLRTWIIIYPCCIGDNFSYLSSCDVVLRAESTVSVA